MNTIWEATNKALATGDVHGARTGIERLLGMGREVARDEFCLPPGWTSGVRQCVADRVAQWNAWCRHNTL